MDLTWWNHEVSLFEELGENLPCLGTILSSYLILTVASCLYGNGKGKNGVSIRTKSGRGQKSDSKWEERQIRNLSQILFHPDFENPTKENDVAILVLDQELSLNLDGNSDGSAKTMATRISNESTSTSMSFMARLCREDSQLSPLQKADPLTTKCPQFLPNGDKLCLLPVDSNSNSKSNAINSRAGNWNCSAALQGSSLICSDEKVGQFLCGILSSPQNPNAAIGNGKIYTSIAPHLKWIQSVSKQIRNSRNSQSVENSVGCGGFINLEEEREMVYKISSNELQDGRGRDSICLWIVSTGRKDPGASIIVTILNNPSAQFNPTSDVIFVDSNFRTREDLNKTINQIGVQYRTSGPFMALYYRSNSSAPNTGFHLKLRDSITQSNLTERLHAKLITLASANVTGSEIQEFSYPSSGPGTRVSTYSSNERTFFILKPQQTGARIRVNLTFLDTEAGYDWLEISTYRVEPITLFRFNGRSNWTEKILEGREDEPLFLYFHSDRSGQRRGFKMKYSEIMPPAPSGCGGLIRLEGEREFVYKVPAHLRGRKSVCVWVVTATSSSQIEYKVLTNSKALFRPQDSDLYLLQDFKKDSFGYIKILPRFMDRSHLLEQPFFLLYFRTSSSASNPGFHIHLKPAGERAVQKTVKSFLVTGITTTNYQNFKYPGPPASEYGNDERTFFFMEPRTRRGKLKLKMKRVDVQRNHDWVQVLSVKSEPTLEFGFSGVYKRPWFLFRDTSPTYTAEAGEPLIIYFHSDRSVTKSGFKLSCRERTARI